MVESAESFESSDDEVYRLASHPQKTNKQAGEGT